MSKASEWAANPAYATRPGWSPNTPMVHQWASVTADGGMFMQGAISAEEALALARWILDTFAD